MPPIACKASIKPVSTQRAGNRRRSAATFFVIYLNAIDFRHPIFPTCRARSTARAKPWKLFAEGWSLDPQAYETDDRLMEISYGAWEGLTLPEVEAHEPGVLERRDREKWDFAPPGGESYRDVGKRVAAWYASVKRDTVVVAHGGVARVLMANFHILPEEEATHAEIAQGVVYVFSGGSVTRHA